jgi:hypothetical protein
LTLLPVRLSRNLGRRRSAGISENLMLRSALLSSALSCLTCCALFTAAHADVYKYKDDKGNVLYTDKPMFLPAERMSIKTTTSDVVNLDETKEEAPRPATPANKPQQTAAEKKTNAEGKAEACNKARQDYLARMSAQRLYEEQPNGEKRFLSEKELESARSSAKQAMDALCN